MSLLPSDLEKSASDTQILDPSSAGRARRLWDSGVETRGIHPVPEEERTRRPYSKIFFIWFAMNFNILSFSAGTLGPAIFDLGLRDSCLTILFFNIVCCIPPAYFSTWGPHLGMRQMVISRYTFGYFGVIVICILNLLGLVGFSILNCILGGQALASVSGGSLSWSVGIVVIAIISLLVSFCGYRVLMWYERLAWIPVLVAYIVAVGVGGKHLSLDVPSTPADAVQILSFASTLAGFAVAWAGMSSDFSCYFPRDTSSWKVFLSAYMGLLLPITSLQCLGAAAACVASSIPDWQDEYQGGDVGGLLGAMLKPVGGFGKFLTVLLSLSVAGNNAGTFYSVSLNLQIAAPVLSRIPRNVFSVITTAIVTSVAIVGAHRFYDTIVNFLGLIGYWSAAYVGIASVEHLLFRKNNFDNYDQAAWDRAKSLPSGLSALAALIASFGLVIPSMHQVWYVGPIAQYTGDIGFEVAFALASILYVPLRWFELRWKAKRLDN